MKLFYQIYKQINQSCCIKINHTNLNFTLNKYNYYTLSINIRRVYNSYNKIGKYQK